MVKGSSVCKFNVMVFMGLVFAESYDSRRDQSIAELNIIRIKSVNLEQGYFIQQITLQRIAVIDIHKLAGHQPPGYAVRGQPDMPKHHKVTIKAGKSLDPDTAGFFGKSLQAIFFILRNMVMTHVGRIGDN